MKLFDVIGQSNYLPALRQARNDGICSLRADMTIVFTKKAELDSPWIVVPDSQRECLIPHSFLLPYFNIIAQDCFDCWKCVYRPPTLKKLFEVFEFQQKRGISAKCGIERRGYSGHKGGYGAFWYVPLGSGLKEAREYTKDLNKQLSGIGASVFLKRGCTEFENVFGPSDKWDHLREPFAEFEKGLRKYIVVENEVPLNTEAGKERELDVIQRWIIHAAEHGDPTYLEYKEKPFWAPSVTYNGSSHREEDYASTYRTAKAEGETADRSRIALV